MFARCPQRASKTYKAFFHQNLVVLSLQENKHIKQQLFNALKQGNCFWSYDMKGVNQDSIPDDLLIAMTLRHLDMPEIHLLKQIFPLKKIKEAWKKKLIPEGPYLHTLNRFIAWYLFDIKKPDTYLKSMQTKHLNHL